jgi:hypothetical protein
MKKSVITILLFSIISITLKAQNPNPPKTQAPATYSVAKGKFGVADAAQIDQLMLTVAGIGSSAKELLNEQTLKSYMMPPRRMSSNDNSAAYALASTLEYYINLNSNYKDNLSPDFMKLNQPQGTAEDYLTFLASTGTVSAAIVPFEAANLTPSVNAAIKYRIRDFLKLFQNTTRPQQKLYDLRKAIMRGNPVIAEINITNEFKNLKNARFWDAQAGDKTPAGKAFVVVVAYNEERKAVEVLNAWGREWGAGGYVWMSYDDFGALATNGYVLLP